VAPLGELKYSLAQLRLHDIAVGSDSRNRTLLSAFRTSSGRNAPSNTKSVFGPSVWLRGIIKPRPGTAIAYVDWVQQEIGIAAAIFGDTNLTEAYKTGDSYLAFAKQAGAAPPTATKWSHGSIRELYKQCVLGVQYTMGEKTLAYRIGQPSVVARELLRLHRATYYKFWEGVENLMTQAMLTGSIRTVFGWTLWITADTKMGTIQNFPMQAHGSEMLRLACCLATERGIKVILPVHDAILLQASADEIDNAVMVTQDAMSEASRVVLDGFELETDVKIVRYPDRYADIRGQRMWDTVTKLVERRIEQQQL
jgi:DNA polymerase I